MVKVFVTGGTGYLGSRLIPLLLARGHTVYALSRKESIARLHRGCVPVLGNALDASTFQHQLGDAQAFVQLVGVPHPSPAKAKAFQAVDLASVTASVAAAAANAVEQFIYVSVAQPAPVMKRYIKVRSAGETLIGAAGLNGTILRPWYILGPGHRWPMAFLPAYWLLEKLPPTREAARRLGLVTLNQMVTALVLAVESPVAGVKVVEVPQIRQSHLANRNMVLAPEG